MRRGRMLRRRSAAVLVAATALGALAFAGVPAQAATATTARAATTAATNATPAGSHALPAHAAGPGFVMADPAPPPAMPSPLDSSGPAQVQALEQKYETDAQNDEQKANQLADEKTSLEQRASDVQNRESTLATQASNLENQSNALTSQVQTLNSEIDAHNAEPHTFQLPDQEAAYAAYNEEKASLDAQKTNLQNQINALTAQSDKLQSDQAKADADQTQLETDVQTHNDAVSALENDVSQLENERQEILSQIDDLLQNYADAQPDGEADAPAAEGGDESEPPAAAAPPAQAQALPSSGGDEAAPGDTEYTPTGSGTDTGPSGSGSAPAPAAAAPTQAPVTVTLSPSTVKGLPASQAENIEPSETFDGLIPEANGDYAAEEAEPPAGQSAPPSRKAFADAVNNGGKATTSIGGRPATIDRVVPVTSEPAADEGGDTPRPAPAAAKPAAPSWVPPVNRANPGNGPPVSIDALQSMLDSDGLGSEAGQFDLEYSPTVLDENGEPTYASTPTDAEGDPELGATGKPIIRLSNLGLQNPGEAESAFDEAALTERLNQDSSPCPHSFSGSTRVLMADGSSEPIAEVRAGDVVENARPGGGTETHRVDQVHVTTTDAGFVDVSVRGTAPGSGGTVTGTANHPYYDVSAGGFADAGTLSVGDRLQSGAGAQATVSGVRPHVGPLVTYDLTIDGLHTYYVLAGDTPVLVHNCGDAALAPDETDASLARDRAGQLQDERQAADPGASNGTTAVFGIFNTQTRQWSTRIGFNGTYEAPEDWLQPGETFAPGKAGAHAEENIVNSLGPNEVIGFGGTTRNICWDVCYRLLNTDGTTFGGAGWRRGLSDKSPYTLFWNRDFFD
ncbi:putative nucleic acid-binding Zn-ribbon protein [Catenulispora sp. GP43]|uniref:polymorphic toxin-type HINT domain-containing protein n=1 Tax=Catenulispora sp. GP43 TaxID=3156263 RepID=UPI00351931E7